MVVVFPCVPEIAMLLECLRMRAPRTSALVAMGIPFAAAATSSGLSWENSSGIGDQIDTVDIFGSVAHKNRSTLLSEPDRCVRFLSYQNRRS